MPVKNFSVVDLLFKLDKQLTDTAVEIIGVSRLFSVIL